jgi:hypothetical protein
MTSHTPNHDTEELDPTKVDVEGESNARAVRVAEGTDPATGKPLEPGKPGGPPAPGHPTQPASPGPTTPRPGESHPDDPKPGHARK